MEISKWTGLIWVVEQGNEFIELVCRLIFDWIGVGKRGIVGGFVC